MIHHLLNQHMYYIEPRNDFRDVLQAEMPLLLHLAPAVQDTHHDEGSCQDGRRLDEADDRPHSLPPLVGPTETCPEQNPRTGRSEPDVRRASSLLHVQN